MPSDPAEIQKVLQLVAAQKARLREVLDRAHAEISDLEKTQARTLWRIHASKTLLEMSTQRPLVSGSDVRVSRA